MQSCTALAPSAAERGQGKGLTSRWPDRSKQPLLVEAGTYLAASFAHGGRWDDRVRLTHMQILETKVRKLEQLVRLKDAKIQTLMAKLQAAGMA